MCIHMWKYDGFYLDFCCCSLFHLYAELAEHSDSGDETNDRYAHTEMKEVENEKKERKREKKHNSIVGIIEINEVIFNAIANVTT